MRAPTKRKQTTLSLENSAILKGTTENHATFRIATTEPWVGASHSRCQQCVWHVIQLPCKWPRSKDTEKRGKVVTFQLSSGKNDKMGVVLGDLVTSRF